MEFLKHVIEANGVFFTLVFLSMSMAAVYFVCFRFIKNYRAHTDVHDYVEDIESQLEERGPHGVIEQCERDAAETQMVLPRLFAACFRESGRGKLAARDAMADCIETDLIPDLNRGLPSILFLIKTAPMVGLLGTVMGMIGAFETIAGATKVNPSDLALDIGMALFTTAEGLLLAIPLMFFYSLFRERIHKTEVDLQRASLEALRMLPAVSNAEKIDNRRELSTTELHSPGSARRR